MQYGVYPVERDCYQNMNKNYKALRYFSKHTLTQILKHNISHYDGMSLLRNRSLPSYMLVIVSKKETLVYLRVNLDKIKKSGGKNTCNGLRTQI